MEHRDIRLQLVAANDYYARAAAANKILQKVACMADRVYYPIDTTATSVFTKGGKMAPARWLPMLRVRCAEEGTGPIHRLDWIGNSLVAKDSLDIKMACAFHKDDVAIIAEENKAYQNKWRDALAKLEKEIRAQYATCDIPQPLIDRWRTQWAEMSAAIERGEDAAAE